MFNNDILMTVLQAWGVMMTIQDLFAQARLFVRAVVQAKQEFVAI